MTAFSATPGAGRGVIAEGDGKIAAGWLDAADIIAAVAGTYGALASANTWAGAQRIGGAESTWAAAKAVIDYGATAGLSRMVAVGVDGSTYGSGALCAATSGASGFSTVLVWSAGVAVFHADPGGTEPTRFGGNVRVGGALLVNGVWSSGILAGGTTGSTLSRVLYGAAVSGSHYLFIGAGEALNACGWFRWDQDIGALGLGVYGYGDSITLGGNTVGFYTAAPVAKQTISGSRGGNAALADLLTKLATLGLITDSTS
jgi:hypothetical protein